MKFRVSHLTSYQYGQPVSLSPHRLYLRPRETPLQRLLSYDLQLSPAAKVYHLRDVHDNNLDWAHFTAPSAQLGISVRFEIETLATNPFDFILQAHAARFPFNYLPPYRFALAPYLAPPFAEAQTGLRAWLDEHFPSPPKETVAMLSALNSLIFKKISYRRREEDGIQPSADTLRLGSGSCRDFAVLFAELCRHLGLATRFVSGYLYAPPEDDHRSFGAMHAWTEVFLPGAGWRGLDPTHGIFCNDFFIPVAHAAEAGTVNPIQGNYYSPHPITAQLQTTVLVEPAG